MSDIHSLLHHLVIAVMSLFVVSFLFMLTCSYAFATDFVRPRPLMEYEDIMLAEELDSSLGTLNERLTACVDAGTANPDECICQLPGETQLAKIAYEKVLKARPKWKGKVLFWKDRSSLQSRNLVMPAIENQLRSSTIACGNSQGRS